MPRNKVRTVLIGIDGATYDLIEPLVEEGVMPEFGALMARGARAKLTSTLHPLTPPAWATIMTGRMPGNHGVFDFIRVDRESENPSRARPRTASTRSCRTMERPPAPSIGASRSCAS